MPRQTLGCSPPAAHTHTDAPPEDVDVPMEDVEGTHAQVQAVAQDAAADNDSSDDEEPPVVDPSTNICRDLEDVLDGELSETFKGSFAYAKTYSDAPNPGLHLLANDIGPIGLPLHDREAKVVISGCRQAPFGKGERTVVDISVRDTWEMDASQVRFTNPAWSGYVHRVLQDVCAALGVDMGISRPRCELYKLLLYETGSHFLPHVDTEKVDTMFATIIIVLPSPFTGGAAHLSHGSLSEVFDCSAESAHQTTVLSWYTDVTHSIKPITSGYRLALSYNLYHTTNALRPSLPSTHFAVNMLRHVLLSWKQMNESDAPRKIIYLLDHQYSLANKTGRALKGLDAHKLAILQMLAKQHGFRLGLASLETRLAGPADDNGGYGHYYNRNVNFMEIESRDTTIMNLTDLDGNDLQEEVDFDEERNECIPQELTEAVEEGDHDDEEYEGYMGNGAGSLERWYRRTVLVIWPQRRSLDMTFDDDIQSAVQALLKATNKPHKRERRLVDFLLKVAKAKKGDRSAVARALCFVAGQWSDRALFVRTMEARGISGVEVLALDDARTAIRTFGFDTVRPVLKKMVLAEKSNACRFQFIEDFKAVSSGFQEPTKSLVLGWLVAQQTWALKHLQAPSLGDERELLGHADKYGGLPLLRDVFVPQLKTMASPAFLSAFAKVLYSEKVQSDASVDVEKAALRSIITDLLSTAISKVDFYEPTKVITRRPSFWSGPQTTREPEPHLADMYMDACLSTDNEALVGVIIGRLIDTSALTPEVSQSRAKTVLLPLLSLVGAKMKGRTADAPAIPAVHQLFEVAIQLYLASLSHAGPTKEDMRALVQASALHGGTGLLVNTIWPVVKAAPYQEAAMLALLQELHDNRASIPTSAGVDDIDTFVSRVLHFVIERAAFAGKAGTSIYYNYDPGIQENGTKAIELLKLCFAHGQTGLCSLVFTRLLDKTFLTSSYIERVLVPFIPELRQFLAGQNTPCHAEPFGAVFTTIVSLWAKHVLGPKPPDASPTILTKLSRNDCRCSECVQAFNFLLRGEGETLRLQCIGAPKRKHVERQLACNAYSAANYGTIRTTPQGLEITKTKAIYEPARWKAMHAKGSAILQSVSSEREELQRVFGARYMMIMTAMGQPVNQPSTVASNAVAPARGPGLGLSTAMDRTGVPAMQAQQQATTSTSTVQPSSRKRKAAHDPSTVIDLSNLSD